MRKEKVRSTEIVFFLFLSWCATEIKSLWWSGRGRMPFLAHNLMSFLKSWTIQIEFALLDVCWKDEITSFFLFSRLLSVSSIISVFCQTWQRHKAFQSSLSTDLLDKVLIETRGSSRVSWCSSSREREEREAYEGFLITVRRFCLFIFKASASSGQI